ncbi:hypothetical protein DQ238_08160 [Geodermatophilus sp. TF02-6]|uniref:excalibur calcium-binding domain-containing protein n=1 Tax=Geodermatophilus sp. TF02-6 TaxID=2250575 RepID=UPI000DE9280C|nr:excalibur calcium-binding domain-containing protein [Geodermatophilus sp. TF02-6]RBY80551.1 hypothetical protein DQ238_08160 [Geodermatophilus sp. TF02-6]
MRRSTIAAGVLVTAALSLGSTGTASAADLNCSDFTTQAEAQASFDSTPGDPNDLDRDDDGIACESLPAGASGGATTEDGTTLAGSDQSSRGTSGDSQVATQPVGAVAAGDGSSAEDGGALPYVLGSVALTAAGGAALAAHRSSRAAA